VVQVYLSPVQKIRLPMPSLKTTSRRFIPGLLYCSAIVLCLLTSPGFGQGSGREASPGRAIEMHRAGDIDGAIREYQIFLAAHPERYDIRSNLGAALARVGRYHEAIEQYQRALRIDPHHPDIHFNLATAYYKSARIGQAAEELRQLIADHPERLNAILLLADCYLQMGENRKVVELITPVAERNPADLAAAYLLGTALVRDGERERGQIYIERIMRRGDSAEARLLMGTTYLLIQENVRAIAELEQAAKLNPQLPAVNAYLGQAQMMAGNTDGAQEYFRRELRINPNDFNSNLQMGILRKQDQKYDEALDYFRKALLVRPNEPNSRYYIASIDLGQGRFDIARERLEGVVRDAPDFVEAHVMLATAYYRLRRKADGDRHQAIVNRLNAERQARQPGAREKP
jgi:tetratricopeptide (TPR) repeat protein